MAATENYKRNVFILAMCQALFLSGNTLIVATTALVGLNLAGDKTYASLPYAAQLIATMLTSIPAALLMATIGRKYAFLVAAIVAMLGGYICAYAIVLGQFPLFIAGSILIGIFSGFANYYRFTVADTVDWEYKSRAISYVLAGGVLAAVVGPNLANFTRDAINEAGFAGSYAATIVLYILSFVLVTFLRLPREHHNISFHLRGSGRPVIAIVRQPKYILAVLSGMLGYAVMILIMTATPLAMRQQALPFSDTAFVIQWHVLGMFVPSFFTGILIRRYGLIPVMLTGTACGLACVFINITGNQIAHYWSALVLLGVSWNFLFIGATTLLTETYHPEERFKAQAINDFIIFSMVAAASLSAGVIHHHFGWKFVNQAAIPALIIILLNLLWLFKKRHSLDTLPDDEMLQEITSQVER